MHRESRDILVGRVWGILSFRRHKLQELERLGIHPYIIQALLCYRPKQMHVQIKSLKIPIHVASSLIPPKNV